MTIDYAEGARLLDAWVGARRAFDGDAWVALFTKDAVLRTDPFSAPLVGDLEVRRLLVEAAAAQEQVEFTVERHWVASDSVLASWHASHVDRATRARVRRAGVTVLDVAADGRIERMNEWWMARPSSTSGREG